LTDFSEILYVFSIGLREGRKLFLIPLGPTQGGAQTEILRFTVDIFVYKWLKALIIIFIGCHCLIVGQIINDILVLVLVFYLYIG